MSGKNFIIVDISADPQIKTALRICLIFEQKLTRVSFHSAMAALILHLRLTGFMFTHFLSTRVYPKNIADFPVYVLAFSSLLCCMLLTADTSTDLQLLLPDNSLSVQQQSSVKDSAGE